MGFHKNISFLNVSIIAYADIRIIYFYNLTGFGDNNFKIKKDIFYLR